MNNCRPFHVRRVSNRLQVMLFGSSARHLISGDDPSSTCGIITGAIKRQLFAAASLSQLEFLHAGIHRLCAFA